MTFPFLSTRNCPKGILLVSEQKLVHQRGLRGGFLNDPRNSEIDGLRTTSSVVFGIDFSKICIRGAYQKSCRTKNLMKWWTVGNFHLHRFCPAFFKVFSRSAIHSNKTKTELFRKIREGRHLWSVGKATSCRAHNFEFVTQNCEQVQWSSPSQNWSSKLVHECHFGLKKMSNTPRWFFETD